VAFSTPGGGLVSGMSSALSLEGWSWEEMSMESAAALNVNWPNPNPRRFRGFGGFGQQDEDPPTYEEQVEQLKDFFAAARAYRDAVAAGEEVRTDSRDSVLRHVGAPDGGGGGAECFEISLDMLPRRRSAGSTPTRS
jgi:hypothetical protein